MMQGRTFKILLAVSLALNIFLLGGAIGAAVMGVRMFKDRMRERPPMVWQAAQALPEDERALLRQALRERALAAAPHVREAREARRQAAELIARADYDPAAVSAALARARAAEQKAREEVDSAVSAFLPRLNPEQRRRLARALASGRLGGPGGRRRFDGPDPNVGPPHPPGPPPPAETPPPP